MSYERKIEVYKIKQNIVTPLASDPHKYIECALGDLVIIIDDDVWIRDWNLEEDNHFTKAIYHPDFVRINPLIFDKQ